MTKKLTRTPDLEVDRRQPWIVLDATDGEPFADCAGGDRMAFSQSCANAARILLAFEACRALVDGDGTNEALQRAINAARIALGIDPTKPAQSTRAKPAFNAEQFEARR